MKHQLSHSIGFRVLAAATASAAVVFGTAAQSGAASSVTVTVHATHFAVGSRAFDNVDDLGAALDEMRPRSIGVDACGPGTTRALMAVAYRLRDRPLHLRVHDRDDAVCAGQAPVALTVGERGLRIDDAAVDRYWRSIAP